MKKTASIIRIIILFTLAFSAMILLMLSAAENNDMPLATFAASVGAFYVFHRLYGRWKDLDEWVSVYDAWCRKGERS